MRAVGIKVLKNKLSEYIRLAASGETILISDRDRIVAEITPPRPDRSPYLADAQLAEAIRKGMITPPVMASAPVPEGKGMVPLSEILKELDRDRSR